MSKPLWMILLIVTGVASLWWGIRAGIDVWHYTRLATEFEAKVESYEVVPRGSKYAIEARYTYEVQGRTFSGKTVLAKPYQLNRRAAENAIGAMKGMQWTAWVDPHHPKESSLQKIFPFKKTLYAAIVVGIFLYFCFLYWYLQMSRL